MRHRGGGQDVKGWRTRTTTGGDERRAAGTLSAEGQHMGFLDKAKEAAEKAKSAAQQAAQQGQDKIEEIKAERAESALLKTLGEAAYAEHKGTGSHDAVATALAALDAHHAKVAADAAAAQAASAATAAAHTPAASTPAASTPAAPDLEEIVIEE